MEEVLERPARRDGGVGRESECLARRDRAAEDSLKGPRSAGDGPRCHVAVAGMR